MDFSKIKKLFYIVAIISMLLSIKSKVFASSFDYQFDNNNYTLLLPDFIDEHNLNYFVDFYYGANGVGFDLIITGNNELNVTGNYQNYYLFNNQQFVYYPYSTSLSNFQAQGMNTFINNASNYFKNLTYSNNYENKQGQYGWGNYVGLYRNDYVEIKTYLSTININQNDNTIFPSNSFNAPYFDNLTEIENGYPDGVFISRGDYSENEALYFHLLKITNTVPDGNQSTYYYDSKVFKLTKDSKYYKTYYADTENEYSYYNIERSALTLDINSSYLYVLSNSGDSITNSYGILQPDIPGGIYDVVESDTSGVITEQQALNDKIANINNNQQDIANSQQEIANNSNNINNYLNENTISNDTNENIDTNLNFNNQNSDLNNLNNGFFTRLTTMLSNISNYNLQEDTVVKIPFPNSQKYLELHSNVFYNNVTGALRTIINAFWTFIFTFYLWKFINKIYISVSSGSILDNFSSSGETITNDML